MARLDVREQALLHVQVTLSLQATADVPGAAGAITSSADIDGVLMLAAQEANITYGGTSVQIVTRCGDGICSPGEPLQKNQDNTGKCSTDCPFTIGECDAPPASGVGNATLQCGGNGVCNPSNLRCDCYAGYAVRACLRAPCSMVYGASSCCCRPASTGGQQTLATDMHSMVQKF